MTNALIFDPSSTAIGWALMPLDQSKPPICAGIISRPKSWDSQLRLMSMAPEVEALIASLAGQIDRIVIETPGKGQSKRIVEDEKRSTPIEYVMAVGMVQALAWRSGLPVVCVQSSHWGKTRGMADKDQRAKFIAYMGWDDGKGDPGRDRCDAQAMGHWYRQRYGTEDQDRMTIKITQKSKVPGEGLTMDKLEFHATNGMLRPVGARWKPAKQIRGTQ